MNKPVPTDPAARLLWLEGEMCRGDMRLTQCYVAGLLVGGVCMLLPYQLSRVGGLLLVVALAHMIARICSVHLGHRAFQSQANSSEAVLGRVQCRLSLIDSVLFNVPFLVGANLVMMGLPLSPDPVRKAMLDCAFLGGTVLLLTIGYLWNRAAILRKLARISPRQDAELDQRSPVS